MTNTATPSDQSTEAVLVSANEFLAGARAGAIREPVEEVRYLDEPMTFADALAWDEARDEWEAMNESPWA